MFISDIVPATGFSNSNYFTKDFKPTLQFVEVTDQHPFLPNMYHYTQIRAYRVIRIIKQN